MTKAIFKEYLIYSVKRWLHQKRMDLGKENQLALLTLDNFSGHCFEADELHKIKKDLNIKLLYFPANTTSFTQPLDPVLSFKPFCIVGKPTMGVF